ncbi:MAG: hypothetical protein ACSLEN_03580 [Candidatus Malihini olakiniferum]
MNTIRHQNNTPCPIDTHTVAAPARTDCRQNLQFTALSDSIWDVLALFYEEIRSAALPGLSQ